VILHLKRDHVLQGLFGIRHRFRTLLLHVDDKDRFRAELEAVIKTHAA
jgi:predicted component of type VI protein secretion system